MIIIIFQNIFYKKNYQINIYIYIFLIIIFYIKKSKQYKNIKKINKKKINFFF